MTASLAVGGATDRLLAGLAPVRDRLGGPAGVLQMMGDDLRYSGRFVAGRREQGSGNPRMQNLARSAQ